MHLTLAVILTNRIPARTLLKSSERTLSVQESTLGEMERSDNDLRAGEWLLKYSARSVVVEGKLRKSAVKG